MTPCYKARPHVHWVPGWFVLVATEKLIDYLIGTEKGGNNE